MQVWNDVDTERPVFMWTEGVPIDDRTKDQIAATARMPFVFRHMAVMPDAHWGMGSTVGTVLPTKGAIIPAAVGVDIGCGIEAVRTGHNANDLPDNLDKLRSDIEKAVPHGMTQSKRGSSYDTGSWGESPTNVQALWSEVLFDGYDLITDKHPKLLKGKTFEQLGTLGGGNHFIEICLDENNDVWIMLHSGSRGVGNRIGRYFIEKAKEDMRIHFINLPDVDLSYLCEGTTMFNDYMEAVAWAQHFAEINRGVMLQAVQQVVCQHLGRASENTYDSVISCHHNYVSREQHFNENILVTRKGAVRARSGELGIIPGSMGAKSYIVRGQGHRESFSSCSHGAGRVMSRGEARNKISIEDHTKAVSGVSCRVDKDVLDESPAAYKDIDAVMAAQTDLVDIVHTLKQVVCVKG